MKPKPRRQRVQQPGYRSEDLAQWDVAPVSTHQPCEHDNATSDVANGMTSGSRVRRGGIFGFIISTGIY